MLRSDVTLMVVGAEFAAGCSVLAAELCRSARKVVRRGCAGGVVLVEGGSNQEGDCWPVSGGLVGSGCLPAGLVELGQRGV
jgi:hypothetical protein